MGRECTIVFAGLLSLANLFPDQARATSLEITPVAVHLLPAMRATTIEIANRGGAPAVIQLRAYVWTQNGDEDVLTPTQDVILSPPIFTIGKAQSQTIRLMLRGAPTTTTERAFRLLIDEVPPPGAAAQQILVAMRISIPVVIASTAPQARPLQWLASRDSSGRLTLTATNPGNVFERIQAITVTMADGARRIVTARGTNSYVLAGARRSWTVTPAGAGRELRLSVTARNGKSEQVLAIAQ